MKAFKPLLADPVEFDKVDFTNLWLSPKLDGIRAIVIDKVVMSRKMIPIPNKYVQATFGRAEFEGLDGELIVGNPCSPTVYNDTYRGTMKVAGEADVHFYTFDHIGMPTEHYCRRLIRVQDMSSPFNHVHAVNQHGCESMGKLLDLEQHYLDMGYEGVMLRAFQGAKSLYKNGRSTAREGTLLKLKRLEDFEAEIIGFEPEMANNNEAGKDAFGNTKRSSHQENKVAKDTLGKLICRYDKNGQPFRVGIFKGFNAEWKQDMWDQRDKLVGQWVKLQKLPIGEIDLPRHPRVTAVLGLRSPIDM